MFFCYPSFCDRTLWQQNDGEKGGGESDKAFEPLYKRLGICHYLALGLHFIHIAVTLVCVLATSAIAILYYTFRLDAKTTLHDGLNN